MSNLDLTIAEIMHGDTQVLKIMKGDSKVWPSGDIAIVLVNISHATCSIGTSRIALHSAFSETLLPETSCIMTSVTVTMGGVDITSTAYDSSDGSLTIADVTGDIIITATAVEVITFEDANVKSICVSNWGGGVIPGEITPAEAAEVTTLSNKFYANSSITKFNELKYFTGLTSLYSRIVSSYAAGQFYNCTGLTEITMPASSNLKDLRGAFRGCSNVNFSELDITPLANNGLDLATAFRDMRVPKIIIPGVKYGTSTWYYTFRCNQANNTYAKLTTITVDGTADFSNVTFPSNCFNNQQDLKNIEGNWTNIKSNLDIHYCPLTVASAIILLNGLYDFIGNSSSTRRTITFKSSLQATFEANSDFIAAKTAAEAKGWTIAYQSS